MTEVIPKWTDDDERQLQELSARRAAAVQATRKRVSDIVDEFHTHNIFESEITDGLIERADRVCAALRPYIKGPFRAILLVGSPVAYHTGTNKSIMVELAEWTTECALRELHASGFVSDWGRDNNVPGKFGNVIFFSFRNEELETLTLVRVPEGEEGC